LFYSRMSENAADLAGALPLLGVAQHSWLAYALSMVHPEHLWLIAV
jgi:hypothetical protein